MISRPVGIGTIFGGLACVVSGAVIGGVIVQVVGVVVLMLAYEKER